MYNFISSIFFLFSKFFHPDPTVKRQSGFLQPRLNNSNILGSSLTLPYFKIISESQDYTFTPTWFDNDILSLQNDQVDISPKDYCLDLKHVEKIINQRTRCACNAVAAGSIACPDGPSKA